MILPSFSLKLAVQSFGWFADNKTQIHASKNLHSDLFLLQAFGALPVFVKLNQSINQSENHKVRTYFDLNDSRLTNNT